MTKLTISLTSVSATANPYLSDDGLLNFSKVATLQGRIADAIKLAAKTDAPLKVLGTYVVPRRAKPTSYKKSLHDKGDLQYRTQRGVKVVLRKRLLPEALARVSILLQAVDSPKFAAPLKEAESAIAKHAKRLESHTAKISKEKGKLREAANAQYDSAVNLLVKKLAESGVNTERDLVGAVGMMGKTWLLRLSKDHVVSIGKSDPKRFAAAVRAAKEAESSKA